MDSEYRAFRELWHIGYPCHPLDFNIVRTTDFINYYEDIWEKIVNSVGRQLKWKKFIKIDILYNMDYETLAIQDTF
jgi:hypothetical protein